VRRPSWLSINVLQVGLPIANLRYLLLLVSSQLELHFPTMLKARKRFHLSF